MHTPGPWRVDDEFSRAHHRYDEGTRVVCAGDESIGICYPVCETTRGWVDEETSPANARLIAAAPDMLIALQTLQGVELPYTLQTMVDEAVRRATRDQ